MALQQLDACVKGKLNIVVFRENTEDVYAGIEWKAGSAEAEKLRQFIERELGKQMRPDSAIGIKPMSEFGSKRLIDMAIRYAVITNGLLLGDREIEFLVAHRFHVKLSFDGVESAQRLRGEHTY